MRISELSARSGVPIATIKYYLREGLLPRGARRAVNQADYDRAHLRRLRLITTLTDVGGLDLSQVRAVVTAIDDPAESRHALLGVAQWALSRPVRSSGEATSAEHETARADVAAYLANRGWQVHPDAPDREVLADALVALRRLDFAHEPAIFDRFAEVAEAIAAGDLATSVSTERDDLVEHMVIGTAVFDTVLVALRHLAQEDASARAADG